MRNTTKDGSILKELEVHLVAADTIHRVGQLALLTKSSRLSVVEEYSWLSQAPDDKLHWIPQHLYFTSDEEIKEGDWLIAKSESEGKEFLHYCIGSSEKYYDVKGNYGLFRHICRKIVATTNPDLWEKKPMESPVVALIPTSFIEVYIQRYNAVNPITRVMLEFDDFINQYNTKGVSNDMSVKLKLRADGTVIVHEVKEKLYTTKELREAVIEGAQLAAYENWSGEGRTSLDDVKKWLDKNYPE